MTIAGRKETGGFGGHSGESGLADHSDSVEIGRITSPNAIGLVHPFSHSANLLTLDHAK
jgi:hypothetical protein